jgi:hypothetical protein
MTTRMNHYLATGLFGLALIAAGCAARDVEVRSPVQGQATVEGDTGSSRSRSEAPQTSTQSGSQSQRQDKAPASSSTQSRSESKTETRPGY